MDRDYGSLLELASDRPTTIGAVFLVSPERRHRCASVIGKDSSLKLSIITGSAGSEADHPRDDIAAAYSTAPAGPLTPGPSFAGQPLHNGAW